MEGGLLGCLPVNVTKDGRRMRSESESASSQPKLKRKTNLIIKGGNRSRYRRAASFPSSFLFF